MSQNNLEIIEFIHRRFKTDCNWMNGNCYYFAVILTTRFPELHIEYLPVAGHFMACDARNTKYYDFQGAHNASDIFNEDHPISFDQLCRDDPKYYARLVRDCIK